MGFLRDLYAFVVPTGVGAEIGGYAGDAGKVAREFSHHFDLIVNPNVVNGGILSAINHQMHYVEGWALDEYLCGNLHLIPAANNKIGVIFDCAIPKNILNIHINTINACKTVMGIDVIDYELTKQPVGVEFCIENGISTGGILNPKTLLEAGKRLVAKGAQAIAVVCFFDDVDGTEIDNANYVAGNGIDPIGGVEAVISHYLTSELMLPTAHAPAFSELEISEKIENPRVASELISSTYLPCTLMGLQNAPQLSFTPCPKSLALPKGLIVPSTTLGSKGVLGAIKNGIQILTVKNPAAIDVSAAKLGLGAGFQNVKEFESYEACLFSLLSDCRRTSP